MATSLHSSRGVAVFQVGWLRASDQTILSVHTRTVTHNARISVSYESGGTSGGASAGVFGVTGSSQAAEEIVNGTWRLHIRQLKESDRDCYMCQINTDPMISELGCLDIHGECRALSLLGPPPPALRCLVARGSLSSRLHRRSLSKRQRRLLPSRFAFSLSFAREINGFSLRRARQTSRPPARRKVMHNARVASIFIHRGSCKSRARARYKDNRRNGYSEAFEFVRPLV